MYSAGGLPYLDGELDVLVHSPTPATGGGVVPPTASAAGGVRVASSGGHGLVVRSFGFMKRRDTVVGFVMTFRESNAVRIDTYRTYDTPTFIYFLALCSNK